MGSDQAGQYIYERGSKNGKRVQSNMGAKNHGVIMPDGKTVSRAIISQSLIGDQSTVSTAVATLPFKKGFTNIVQASLESTGIMWNP